MDYKFRESETLELKKSTAELRAAVASIAAILNKHGMGELYFGIKNDGTIVGQSLSERTLREVSQSIAENIEPKIYPEIKTVKIEDKSCIYIKFSGSEIPYYAFGRAYKRIGDEDRKLSAKEIETIILDKNKETVRWENQLSKKDISQVNEDSIKKFIKKENRVGRLPFEYENEKITLQKLNLIDKDRLLNAASVLFCDDNALEVQMAIFAGKDKLTFLDIKRLSGNVFDLLDEMELYIKNHINWQVKFGKLAREEIPEIPMDAVREALVNSLCHRDYRIPKSNEIAIFKDRVEIYNPGDFPIGFTPKDFIEGKERSILRNPLISQTLYFSKDVEKWGSGLKRIAQSCIKNQVNIEFYMLKTGFLVVFYRKGVNDDGAKSEGVNEGVNGKVAKSEGVNEGVNGKVAKSEGVNEGVNGKVAESEGVNEGVNGKVAESEGVNEGVNGKVAESEGVNEGVNGKGAKSEGVNEGVNGKGAKSEGVNEGVNGKGAESEGVNEGVNGKVAKSEGVNEGVNGKVAKSEGVNEGVNGKGAESEGVKEEEEYLLSFIKSNPGLRTPVISETLSIPRKTVERRLRKLKESGKVIFSGSSKTGGYYVRAG